MQGRAEKWPYVPDVAAFRVLGGRGLGLQALNEEFAAQVAAPNANANHVRQRLPGRALEGP